MFGCTAPPQDFHWSPFSFSESRTAFSFAGKRKSGFGPRRAGKKVIFPAKGTPHPYSWATSTPIGRDGLLCSRATSATPSENHPPRRRGYQRTGNGIPPTQRQWRKRDHESLKRRPPETGRTPQSLSPEEQHLSIGNLSCCTAPPQDFHRSTFSSSESRTAFSFASKRKSGFTRKGYAPSVRRHSRQRLGCGPCWAGKNQRKVKTSRFPTKEKAVFPARDTPHP